MKVPLEVQYRGVRKTPDLEKLIQRQTAKLERVCDYLNSCRVSVEKPSPSQPHHVRIDLTVPPSKELVVSRDPAGVAPQDAHAAIRKAFQAARRKLKELVERQRGEVKDHVDPETQGFVVKVLPEQGYGFIRSLDGREVYFHQNSLVERPFEDITIGTGVRFFPEQGEKGLQASSVSIVDKPGARAAKLKKSLLESPLSREENR